MHDEHSNYLRSAMRFAGDRRRDEIEVANQQERRGPLRVLFFSHTAAQGGAEIALLNLVQHLDRKNITPIVVFASDGPTVEKIRPFAQTFVLPLDASVVEARKDSLGFASVLKLRAAFGAAAYVWILARFIRQYDIDLVHTNTLKADLLGGFAARLSRRPIVWHIRDRIDDDYLPSLVVRIFRLLCRVIPDFVVANSNATLQSLRLGAPAVHARADVLARSSVVHDGTHLPVRDHRVRERRELIHVGLIGRICPWKGQHIFVQAAALVHQRFPNARFLIVGSALFGEVGYDRDVRRLPDVLGIKDVVTFAGFCIDVPAIIDGMDLIVHASTIGEPFGQVIIEAMSAGKPVVATNGGGVPEIVEDGKTGILVPMGDVQVMAEAICRIIADPDLATEMGARGRARVRKHFTIEQTARKVESIYRQVM
jgi:glycosyltransferase involved in cell wall biosynthesis